MAGIEYTAREFAAQIRGLVEPVIELEGMELVEVEYRRESTGWVLRLFVDKEGGVSVDDCARMSRVVSDLLDVADPIDTPYHLEVSSPGLDRPLRKADHFRRNVGSIVSVKTITPIEKRRKFKGILSGVDDEGITLELEGHAYRIPLAAIERARLCFFDSAERSGPA